MADNNIKNDKQNYTSSQDKEGENEKNPRNSESALYVGLTRLFSGPLASFRSQSPIRQKRRDLDRYKFTSASGQAFKKKSYNPFEAIQSNIMANQSRAERYSDFDQMEFMPELASALDIYADEMTTSNAFRQVVIIDCRNEEIKNVLYNLFFKILNIESNLFSWCRTMCKFGDFFLYLDIDEKLGVKNVLGLPSPELERLEGQDETNPNYVQFQWNSAGMTFESWQIAHFRVLGQDKYSPYGTSILEPARRIWRQLQLMEDAMMAYRIVRAPERRVFYIDVGNVAPQEVEQYIQKIMVQMKRNQIVDPSTGRVDLRYNPMSIDEDFYLPVRGTTSATKIENLPGGQFQGDIDDVQYLRDKLFSAIKIPQSYLTSAKDKASDDKSTLAQKDIRFARTIQRLQRVIISELEKIGIIHLYTLGYRNEDLLSFKLKLNNPSKISELQELEHFSKQVAVGKEAKELGFSNRWIYENVFRMQENEVARIHRDLFYDKNLQISLEALGSGGDQTAGGSGGGGGLGGDLAGGGGDVGGEAGGGSAPETPGGEAGAAPSAAGGEAGGAKPEDNNLLAAPARRPDGSLGMAYTKAGWHGKLYMKVASDQRKNAGMSKSIKRMIKPESTSGDTNRSMFPDLSAINRNSAGIHKISKGLYESEHTEAYQKDEELLLEVENKLQSLSKALFNKEKTLITEEKQDIKDLE
jgi:uncharacterized membrane protein YgcG